MRPAESKIANERHSVDPIRLVIAPTITGDFVNGEDFLDRAERVATVAAAHASSVDDEHRFPREAIEALRAERLLGILVPSDLGGAGANVMDVANVCYALGRACASTAMIFAMHQVKVACIVRHGRGGAWLEANDAQAGRRAAFACVLDH